MKEVKTFIIVEIILAILKAVAGLLCHSYTMLASCLYEIVLIFISLFVLKNKENKKYKGIITSFVGMLVIFAGLGIIFVSVLAKVQKVSWLILLFVFVGMLVRYIAGCFYSNTNYRNKKGILGFSNINSNMDFYLAGIIVVVLILSKLSKFVELFKYADKIGTILISLIVIYKGFKVIRNSFKYMSDDEILFEGYEKELTGRTEVKKFVSINTMNFGGIRKAKCNLILNNNITMIDLNTFVVSLQDYFLKIVDVIEVNLIDDVKPKKPKVRSLKQDARNSRSGNSKTNTKKKNSTKKNKKR